MPEERGERKQMKDKSQKITWQGMVALALGALMLLSTFIGSCSMMFRS